MNLHSIEYRFILLTPAMLGGAGGRAGNAEMRIASIRGQIRWWHRFSGIAPDCNQVWGQTEPTVIASKVSLTLAARPAPQHHNASILPHHHQGAQPDSLDSGESFTLILRRLVGCTAVQWTAAQNAVKLWLLLGGLGLRVNRAAGSVWPLDDDLADDERWVPKDAPSLRALLAGIGYSRVLQLAAHSILDHTSLTNEITDPLKLRHAASDTVSVPTYFGSINPRVPSPLKMKVILLGSEHRLLLTGSLRAEDFSAAHRALGVNKPLGSVPWV